MVRKPPTAATNRLVKDILAELELRAEALTGQHDWEFIVCPQSPPPKDPLGHLQARSHPAHCAALRKGRCYTHQDLGTDGKETIWDIMMTRHPAGHF